MKLVREINLLEKSKKMIFLYVLANLTIIPFFFFFSWLGHTLTGISQARVDLVGFYLVFIIFFVLIAIHELIHGLFYKLVNPRAKIRYAFHGLAFSTSSPGDFYSPGQMLLVGLAPFVIITCLLTLFLLAGWLYILSYILLASFHAAGCFGDFYCAGLLLLKYRRGFLIEDTGPSLNIYQAS